jgi:poly(A) polymerase Pap1
MTLRFNLEDEIERNAAEFLKQLDRKEHKSKNRFVIELIAAHADSLNKERLEDKLLEKIRLMFREEIADISIAIPAEKKTTAMDISMTKDEKEENIASVLSDLEMFG